MKTLFLSLSILCTFSFYAQSRSRIINQINHYKYSLYAKEELKVSYDEFTPLIIEYFKKEGFLFFFNKDSSLTFKKKVPITYKYDDSYTPTPRGRHGSHEKGRANFLVTADLTPINGKTKYPIINASTREYVIPI